MRIKWLKAWIVQFLIMLAACVLQSLSLYLPPIVNSIVTWAAIPLLGLYTAYRAVLGGLINYAAWIAPPACMIIAHYAVWGFVPHMGAVLVCAFVSLVGAAAGDVMMRENQRKKH